MTEKDLTLRMEHATQALTKKLRYDQPSLATGGFPAGLAHLILSAENEQAAYQAARDGIRKMGVLVYDHDVKALVKLALEAADRPLTAAEEEEEEREARQPRRLQGIVTKVGVGHYHVQAPPDAVVGDIVVADIEAVQRSFEVQPNVTWMEERLDDHTLTAEEMEERKRERGRGLVITPEGDLKHRPVEQAIAERLDDSMKGDPMNPNEPLDLTMLVDGKEVKPFEGIEPGPTFPTYAEQGLDPHEAMAADARVAFREHEPDDYMQRIQQRYNTFAERTAGLRLSLDPDTVTACIDVAEEVDAAFSDEHNPTEGTGAGHVANALRRLLERVPRSNGLVPPNDPRFRVGDLVALMKPQKGESVTLPVDLQGEVVEGSYGGYVAVDFSGARWGVPWHELRLVESAWDRQREVAGLFHPESVAHQALTRGVPSNWNDPDKAMKDLEKAVGELRERVGPEFIGGGIPYQQGDLLKLTSPDSYRPTDLRVVIERTMALLEARTKWVWPDDRAYFESALVRVVSEAERHERTRAVGVGAFNPEPFVMDAIRFLGSKGSSGRAGLLAEGETLDRLGASFDEPRNGDDDATYRARLREKLKAAPSRDDLLGALKEANEVLRSAHHIAMREGMETNWAGFLQRVQDVLANQHALLVKDHDRWCRGGPGEKPCRPGDPPKEHGSCGCHPPDAIAHVVALLREAERRALSEAARLGEQRKGPRTRSIEWDVAKDLDLIARSARALASQADGLRRPPVSPPPGPPSTAPPSTRAPGSHPLIMDDVVRSSAPAGALGATVEIPPGRAFINGKLVVDVASVVAEHKKTCDLHVASGSNRHRASSYDVVACALKDALIEVDRLTKTKREAEARAAEQVKLFDEAVGRVDVAKTALERIVGEATGRVEPEKPTYREAVVNVRFPQDLDHTPEEAKVLYDPDLKMGDRLRNVGQWLYVRRLPSDTAPDTIGRDGIFVRWGRLDG